MAKSPLAELGRELDDAERAASAECEAGSGSEEQRFRFYAARRAYEAAQDAEAWAKLRRFRESLSKRTPTNADGIRLKDARSAAEDRLDEISEAGPEFCTRRDLCDALTEAWLTVYKYDASQEKFEDDHRQRRSDARAGIVRVQHRRRKIY